ncbi:ribosomal protein S5 domain 2-type protein [Fimicolochytrium jonesii]|uniref:ribosomal protein S5 domain 2-type protein n=1 Tax=Fimicolochytrium jonesii TaxID=1396493 RepID=UPI0022FF3220|nr:ribosomal protein S5 domain 2-type protein [Fimicolochytrium jonesii]KAI8827235.1 ribosomal protein S5 domain 2-type protein [Fimicolochytrium jonesii]
MDDAEESNNKVLQQEELVALSSIYGPEFVSDNAAAADAHPDAVTIKLTVPLGPVLLECHLPSTYPSQEPPYYELVTAWRNRAGNSFGVSDSFRRELDGKFLGSFVPGEVIIFEWVELLKSMLEERYGGDDIGLEFGMVVEAAGNPTERHGEGERPSSSSTRTGDETRTPTDDNTEHLSTAFPMIKPPNCPPITHSTEPLVERKSVFVAHVSPITTPDQVAFVLSALLTNNRIRRATHNILAYRIVEPNGVIRQDCDDDGETAAGGRLLHMLQLADVRGAMVVVTRWYGGVHLGPQRFKLINNCARSVLEATGFMGATGGGSDGKRAAKKR